MEDKNFFQVKKIFDIRKSDPNVFLEYCFVLLIISGVELLLGPGKLLILDGRVLIGSRQLLILNRKLGIIFIIRKPLYIRI